MSNFDIKITGTRLDYLDSIHNAQTIYDIFLVLKQVCNDYSCEYFIVSWLPAIGEKKFHELVILTNWAPELIRAYDALEYISVSPIFRTLKETTIPFRWNLKALNSTRVSQKRPEINALLKKFDHLSGAIFPVANRLGTRGMVGFSGVKFSSSRKKIAELHLISTYVFDHISKLEENPGKLSIILTDREKECVMLTAAGLTSSEIAEKIEVTANTINHYMSTVADKLNTKNRAHTVAKCIKLGLLDE